MAKLTFEEAYKKLSESYAAIEAQDASLEDAIKAYEATVKYYDECKLILNDAKGRIEEIEKRG
ncbi:MAG: exodeoxyribonuclease VII small subunit [Clostridiales Family XIII bacterium]|jgi:exodeoxyribonuclease VII small subunit|nr:exodeoxyribonuclease VII small subunit [Clostridiales Family XIII bacterium]